jgi:hypothetical protein
MTTPGPTGRDRAEPGPVQAVVRLFLGQLLAVIAIAAAITVVVTLLDPDDSDVRAGPQGSSPRATAAGTSASSPPPPASSPVATTTPPPTSPAPSATAEDRPPRVDVLNQSAPDGSAKTVADQLRAAGWRIGRVDDFNGNISTTTVYWLDREDRKAARQLARDMGGVRVQPGFSTLVEGRLSVILVD